MAALRNTTTASSQPSCTDGNCSQSNNSTTDTKGSSPQQTTQQRRVSFAEQEVAAIHEFEAPNQELIQILYYQSKDYDRFRAELQAERIREFRIARTERRLQALQERARQELELQQAKLSLPVACSSTPMSIPLPIPSIADFRSDTKGCAQVA